MTADKNTTLRAVIDALKAWQESALAEGDGRAGDLSQSLMMRLANGAWRGKLVDSEVVAAQTPDRLKPLAPTILAAIEQAVAALAAADGGPAAAAPKSSAATGGKPPAGRPATAPGRAGGQTGSAADASAGETSAGKVGAKAGTAGTAAAAESADGGRTASSTGETEGEPEAQTAPSEEEVVAEYSDDLPLDLVFAKFDTADEAPDLAKAEVDGLADGKRISWPPAPADGRVHLFRLVVSDGDARAWVPEVGELLAVTKRSEVDDTRPYTRVRRYYTVFRNSGDTLDEARAAKAVKVAEGLGLGDIEELELVAQDRTVKGFWKVPPGTERVRVHRTLARNAANGLGPELFGSPFSGPGFMDADPPLGETVVYSALVLHDEGGQSLGSAVKREEIAIPAPKWVIEDFEARAIESPEAPGGGAGPAPVTLSMSWTEPPPAYKSRIYLVHEFPTGIAAGDEMPVESLAANGLPDLRLVMGSAGEHSAGGKHYIQGYPWPSNIEKVYLVPVVVSRERAWVGAPAVPPGPLQAIRDAVVRERVNRQVISFEWPRAADRVEARLDVPGQDPSGHGAPGGDGMPYAYIERQDYKEAGGFALDLDVFGDRGEGLIYLTPVRERPVDRAEPTPVAYRALSHIDYFIDWPRPQEVEPARPATLLRKATPAKTRLWPPRPILHIKPVRLRQDHAQVGFVVVAKPGRVPLFPKDTMIDGGTQVQVSPVVLNQGNWERRGPQAVVYIQPSQLGTASFELNLDMGRPGGVPGMHSGWYLRLFVSSDNKEELRSVVLRPPAGDVRVPPLPAVTEL
ncbi:MAG: hypothetical protein LBS27_12270 [Bifidobacteriaceae bacterium]|jgi:hypothetical protein|nr:hypothetical protein [Bifidobacteriaceae bacterium]